MSKLTKLKRCPLCNSTNTNGDHAGYDGTLRKICMERWCEDCNATWLDNFEYVGSADLVEGNSGDPAEFPPDRIMP
jgi:transposase-like protein